MNLSREARAAGDQLRSQTGLASAIAVLSAAGVPPQQVRAAPMRCLSGAAVFARCASIQAEYERRSAGVLEQAEAAEQTQRARCRLLSVEQASTVQTPASRSAPGARQ